MAWPIGEFGGLFGTFNFLQQKILRGKDVLFRLANVP